MWYLPICSKSEEYILNLFLHPLYSIFLPNKMLLYQFLRIKLVGEYRITDYHHKHIRQSCCAVGVSLFLVECSSCDPGVLFF